MPGALMPGAFLLVSLFVVTLFSPPPLRGRAVPLLNHSESGEN